MASELNLIGMLVFLAWFASGFVPGYFVAQRHGLVSGLIAGFAIFLLVMFSVNRLRIALGGKRRDGDEVKGETRDS